MIRSMFSMSRHRLWPAILSIVHLLTINVVLFACLLEIGLRVQQKFGPLYNLDLHFENLMPELSEKLNHAPEAGTLWDRDGIRILDAPNRVPCFKRVLFLGDSFMEGVKPTRDGGYLPTDSSDTIPVQVRDFYRELTARSLCVFNAGFGSYAPSIYIPQAKKLIPMLRPDLVIVDVDETDIWDDFYRYRELTVRDDNGSIVAVRPSPNAIRFYQGLVASTDHLFYVQRLIAKLYFIRFQFPKSAAKQIGERPDANLLLARLPETELKRDHAAEIAYFTTTLEDLTSTIVSLAGGTRELVYIHHPHLQHLREAGAVFNTVVAEMVRQVAAEHHVRFYDATRDIKSQSGGEPEKYYFPDDMHFNSAGTRIYGMAVAKFLADQLAGD